MMRLEPGFTNIRIKMLSVRSNRAPLVLGAQDFSRALTQPSRVGKRVAPVLLVKQVMRSPGKKLVTLDESGTIRDALRQLISAKTTGAPVLNNRGELIGVVSLTGTQIDTCHCIHMRMAFAKGVVESC
jgi:CBS-domain-containing membrane protein